jgi:hypothetical protein
LKTLRIYKVDSRETAKSRIIVRFLRVNHCATCLNHYFPPLEID